MTERLLLRLDGVRLAPPDIAHEHGMPRGNPRGNPREHAVPVSPRGRIAIVAVICRGARAGQGY